MKHLTTVAIAATLWFSTFAHGGALDANTLISRAYELPRVDDQIATLTFTFSAPDKSEQRFVYTMVWKNMKGEDGYDNKAIFFTESPPDKKGIAYLGWLGTTGSAKQDDEWIYLPELRMTRRIAHRDHAHAHDDDEFGNSLLEREHLDPRPPALDNHTLIGEERLDGIPHFVVASTPKQRQSEAAKTVRWIDKENFRINRAQYFDNNGKTLLNVSFQWTRIDGFWLWKSVTAINPETQAKTVMEIDTTGINTGLRDRDFAKRNIERGSANFRR